MDGLIHITDLSWGRIKHPSEVVKPNQEVDVKILSLDPERERIQLGYKQLQPHPWDGAVEKFPVGEVVDGKVVRITDFGAFVELEPGLDGLVHISQCSTARVAKVEDAVKVGDEVKVKVLGVDPEKKRISLSIRQAIEPEPVAEEAAETPAADTEYEVVATESSVSEKFAEAAEEVKEAVEEKAEEVKEAARSSAKRQSSFFTSVRRSVHRRFGSAEFVFGDLLIHPQPEVGNALGDPVQDTLDLHKVFVFI